MGADAALRYLFCLALACFSSAELSPWDKDLIAAAGEGELEKVASLLDAGANVNARSEYGETPLHVAAIKCDLDVVKALIAAGADVNAKTNPGAPQERPPLHRFIPMNTKGMEQAVGLLLEAGADPNLTNELGENALDIAVKMGESRAGAAQKLRDAGGKETPKESRKEEL